jgi:hypothetical protein
VDAISFAEEGQVEVVVDYEEGAGVAGESAEAARQGQEFASPEELVAELEDVGAAAQGGGGQGCDAVRFLVGGDDVEAGGLEPLEEGVSRGGAKATEVWSAVVLCWTSPPALRATSPASGEDR